MTQRLGHDLPLPGCVFQRPVGVVLLIRRILLTLCLMLLARVTGSAVCDTCVLLGGRQSGRRYHTICNDRPEDGEELNSDNPRYGRINAPHLPTIRHPTEPQGTVV